MYKKKGYYAYWSQTSEKEVKYYRELDENTLEEIDKTRISLYWIYDQDGNEYTIKSTFKLKKVFQKLSSCCNAKVNHKYSSGDYDFCTSCFKHV